MSNELRYTAITRAKEQLYILDLSRTETEFKDFCEKSPYVETF